MPSLAKAFLASHLLLVAQVGSSYPLSDKDEEVSRSDDTNRIIGGTQADGRYPYSVSMRNARGHYCGGSLIAKDTVLTAAHCLTSGDPTRIVIGHDEVSTGQKRRVRKSILHPNHNSNLDRYDIGLVFLVEPTTITNIPLVRLNNDDSFPEPGTTSYVVGWGDTDPGTSQVLSNTLLVTDVQVISNQECKDMEVGGQKYGGWVFDDMLCAYTDGQDACQGDSGGPLIKKGATAQLDIQVGVVSWGSGCSFLPGVYSRISKGYDWIKDTVCVESVDPPDSLCKISGLGVTDQPTVGTTREPMENPTKNPTSTPTKGPSISPTKEPTNDSPSKEPSKSPTHEPTTSPTYIPTFSPTFSPTEVPTLTPSYSPTSAPSFSSAPTGSPSASPSISSNPTTHPSDAPSISLRPSMVPSTSPSTSSQPTESPSLSLRPSAAPSAVPTSSNVPTISLSPSAQPSTKPSQSPSASSFPSVASSAKPSVSPSYSPTMTMPPTVSTNPTRSSAPSPTFGNESDLLARGSLLLGPRASRLNDNDKGTYKASAKVCQSPLIGALLSIIISVWVMI